MKKNTPFNHIAGFAANYQDVSFTLTGVFAVFVVPTCFVILRIYKSRVDIKQEYESILNTVCWKHFSKNSSFLVVGVS